jgi:sirohydrochlorin ferrochelatase
MRVAGELLDAQPAALGVEPFGHPSASVGGQPIGDHDDLVALEGAGSGSTNHADHMARNNGASISVTLSRGLSNAS